MSKFRIMLKAINFWVVRHIDLFAWSDATLASSQKRIGLCLRNVAVQFESA